jgi:CheY-like chemotaxis protein
MLRRLIGEDIELVTRLEEDLWPVLADPAQIEQVVMNLAVNARDSMPQGGRLTLETQNLMIDAEAARHQAAVVPGPYVRLIIADTGHGMSEEVQARAFEPFFTTKTRGKGTGLGLSTVYGIVTQSGGHVTVESQIDEGTAFSVVLPRTTDVVREPASEVVPAVPIARGTEVILLVEDDDAVRSLVEEVLVVQGYSVIAAAEGQQALRLAGAREGPIDLLVTDVIMPRMSGRELADQLVDRRPGMRVLYMSGYTDDAIMHHGVLERPAFFLPKPFRPEQLATKVRRILDGLEDGDRRR